MNCITRGSQSRHNLGAKDSYEGRCGMIFITRRRSFILHCSLCNYRFGTYEKFIEHVLTQHYAPAAKDKNDLGKSDTKNTPSSKSAAQTVERHDELQSVVAAEEHQLEIEDLEDNIVIKTLETEDVIPVQNKAFEPKKIASSLEDCKTTVKLTVPRIRNSVLSCGICGRLFPNESTLRGHVNRHTDERRFRCDQCGAAFKEEHNLRFHMKRHTETKRFQCSQCIKHFFTRTERRIHERRHRGERPFVCTSCGLTFVTSGSLRLHMRRHNNERPHACKICEKRFFDNAQLKDHMAVHTQDRSHVCETCNAKFTRRKALVVHMKLHINAREYACTICEHVAFNQCAALAMHMRNKHKIVKQCKSVENHSNSSSFTFTTE